MRGAGGAGARETVVSLSLLFKRPFPVRLLDLTRVSVRAPQERRVLVPNLLGNEGNEGLTLPVIVTRFHNLPSNRLTRLLDMFPGKKNVFVFFLS